jgi:gamma-glutamyltranspeptidase / glutathione hydrolase
MSLQDATDRPTFHTTHFPNSFYPHDAHPGVLVVEGRIPEATRKELESRGHTVRVVGDWANGKVMAAGLNRKNGVLSGAVSPRGQIGYVMGW